MEMYPVDVQMLHLNSPTDWRAACIDFSHMQQLTVLLTALMQDRLFGLRPGRDGCNARQRVILHVLSQNF